MDPAIMAREYAMSTLRTLRQAVERRDLQALAPILAEDVLFFSPLEAEATAGKARMLTILRHMFLLLDDFVCVGGASGGAGHALRFSASVSGLPCEGATFILLNADGKVGEFVLFIRPLSALQELEELLEERLARPSLS